MSNLPNDFNGFTTPGDRTYYDDTNNISRADFDTLSREFGATRRHPDDRTVDVYSMNNVLIATRIDNGRGRDHDYYYATSYGFVLLGSLERRKQEEP